MIGIYRIQNPSGKVYIGQSTDILRRWKQYEWLNGKSQIKLFNSFSKYGIDSHTFEILEECVENKLNERERYWQDYYNVVSDGLNCRLTKTTDKSGRLSEETKKRIGNANRGNVSYRKGIFGKYLHNNETKEKMSKSKFGMYKGKDNPFYGKTHSEETKKIIREKRKLQVFTEETKKKISKRLKKPILQYTMEGVFVKEYPSRNKAAEELGINPTMISNNVSGRKKSAGGYIWKYK